MVQVPPFPEATWSSIMICNCGLLIISISACTREEQHKVHHNDNEKYYKGSFLYDFWLQIRKGRSFLIIYLRNDVLMKTAFDYWLNLSLESSSVAFTSLLKIDTVIIPTSSISSWPSHTAFYNRAFCNTSSQLLRPLQRPHSAWWYFQDSDFINHT